eukprot:g58398.t1
MAVPGILVGYNLFRRLYRIYLRGEGKIVEQRNVRFDASVRGNAAKVDESLWEGEYSYGYEEQQDVGTPHWELATNSTQVADKIENETELTKDESLTDSTIVVVEHDSSNYREDRNVRVPVPGLEEAPRVEETPLRNNRGQFLGRMPTRRRGGRVIQFPDVKVHVQPKPKAPRDIKGNTSDTNVVSGPRIRRQTPANVATDIILQLRMMMQRVRGTMMICLMERYDGRVPTTARYRPEVDAMDSIAAN